MENGFYAFLFAYFTVSVPEVCIDVGQNPMQEEAEFLYSGCLFIKLAAQNSDW